MAKSRNIYWINSPASDERVRRRAGIGAFCRRCWQSVKRLRRVHSWRAVRTGILPDFAMRHVTAWRVLSSSSVRPKPVTRSTAEKVVLATAMSADRVSNGDASKMTTLDVMASDFSPVPVSQLASRVAARARPRPKVWAAVWAFVKKRLFCGLVIRVVSVVVVGVLAVQLVHVWLQQYPIRRVVFRSDFQHVNAEMIQPELDGLLRTSLLELNLSEVRERLLAVPWIEQVDLRRSWPDTLEIALREKRAVARWGEKGLVSDQGEVFIVPLSEELETFLAQLPILMGPEDDVAKMLDYHEQMSEILSPAHLKITALTRGSRSWKIELGGTIHVLVNYEGALDKLVRFRQVYEQLGEQKAYVKAADLRYHHGVAIKWLSNDAQEADVRQSDHT
ncbi:MAG: cell division protein FtsQ/DivIB [Gammaproteobacteria bacterium]